MGFCFVNNVAVAAAHGQFDAGLGSSCSWLTSAFGTLQRTNVTASRGWSSLTSTSQVPPCAPAQLAAR